VTSAAIIVVLALSFEEYLLLLGEVVPVLLLELRSVRGSPGACPPRSRLDGGGDGVVLALDVDGGVDLEPSLRSRSLPYRATRSRRMCSVTYGAVSRKMVLHRVDLDGSVLRFPSVCA